MITLDTSAILAVLNREDEHHELIIRSRNAEARPWIIPTSVLAEVCFLVERSLGTQTLIDFLRDIERGAYILACGEPDMSRIVELIRQYADMPLGYADAAVVSCAERHEGRVLTTDWRHFHVVARPGTITVVPLGPHAE